MDIHERLHALDAVRAFALLAGVVLHATMSFLPGFGAAGWPIVDNSPSATLGVAFYVIHAFRMTTFFLIAGFFGHLLLHRLGARAFVRDRRRRILVPLVVGWIVLFPLTLGALVLAVVLNGGQLSSPATPDDLLPFPLAHLWFLHVLVLLYAAALVARAAFDHLIDRSGRVRAALDRVMVALVRNPLASTLFAIPLAFVLWLTPGWVPWLGIPTPDRSLIPNLAAAVGFGTAFGAGWFLHRQPQVLSRLQRLWPVHLAVAFACTAAGLTLAGVLPTFVTTVTDESSLAYAVVYSIAVWSWTFAIVGLALRYCSDHSPTRRYVADASYWIYLVHLPLVFYLQIGFARLPWHWAVKFPLLMAMALGLLFASYHYLVRNTFLGERLNGRRYAPRTHARGGVSSNVEIG